MSSDLRVYGILGGEYYVHFRTVKHRCIADSQYISCDIMSDILSLTARHLQYSFIVLEVMNCISRKRFKIVIVDISK